MGALQDIWSWIVRNILEPAELTRADLAAKFGQVPEFLVILLFFLVVARLGAFVLRRTVFARGRMDPIVGALFVTIFQGLVLLFGFAAALTAFGINLFGLALTVGLIGAGLALGLQDTVANVMGGVSLALDRPFEVGDRIKIGDTWGDVEEIGLRSTKILTIRRELVSVPNRLMDQAEIWNYSGRYPELRIEVPVGISYDSDWRLAERLMIEAANTHPQVLAFPPPVVLMSEFGDSGVELELRVYIGDGRARPRVQSDLRKAIKDRFDAEGVEIPFPYRTLVYKTDLPAPKHEDRAAHPAPVEPRKRRIAVATAGAIPAGSKAKTIVALAKRLDADLVVVYIAQRAHIGTGREGERAASAFHEAAARLGINVTLRIKEGDVVNTIARVVDEEKCGGVVIGAPRHNVLLSWTTAQVPERLRDRLDVPVIVVPGDLRIDEDEVEAVRAHFEASEGRDDPAPPVSRGD